LNFFVWLPDLIAATSIFRHIDVDRIIQWWFTVLRFEEIILHYQLYMMTMHADHLDKTIVLRLYWFNVWVPGFDWVIRFWPSRLGQFVFKLKRHSFSKKKTKVNGFVTRSCRINLSGHTEFFFPCFFFNPVWFQSQVGRVPGRSVGLGRISKLWMRLFSSLVVGLENLFLFFLFWMQWINILDLQIACEGPRSSFFLFWRSILYNNII